MKGLFALLSEEQKAKALAFSGNESFGRDECRLTPPRPDNESTHHKSAPQEGKV